LRLYEQLFSTKQSAGAAGSPSRAVRDDEFDRDFYLAEEDGHTVRDTDADDASTVFLGDEKKFAEREADMARYVYLYIPCTTHMYIPSLYTFIPLIQTS
jgi:hypothetical protein